MKILAVEFSSSNRAVAAVDNDATRASVETGAGMEHGALEMVEEVLSKAGWERGEVECIAIGLGPGSYTGIRSAIALAQGWQLARPDIKLTGLSSMDSMAAAAVEAGWRGLVELVVDAQRNELYTAEYELRPEGFVESSGLRIVPVEAARSRMSPDKIVAGPEAGRWFSSAKIIQPSAATLGRLAGRRKQFVNGEALEPIYLRETAFLKMGAAKGR